MQSGDWAALRMATACADKQGMNVVEIAYMVMYAEQMPWYRTLTALTQLGMGVLSEQEEQALKRDCVTLKRVIDRGYDQERDRWWPILEETERLAMMDLGHALEVIRDGGSTLYGLLLADSRIGLRVVFSILLGPRWRQEHAAIKQAADVARQMRFK